VRSQSLIITANGILAAVLLVWTQGWWGILVVYGQSEIPTTTFTAEFMLILIYITILTCLASLAIAWQRYEEYGKYATRLFLVALGATVLEVLATLFSYLARAFYGSQLRPSFESVINYEAMRYPMFGILSAFTLIYLVCLTLIVMKPTKWQGMLNKINSVRHHLRIRRVKK